MINRQRKLTTFAAAFCLILAFGVALTLAQTPDLSQLTAKQVIERELKGDESHSYNLALTAGQYLDLVVEQKGIDVVVTLFDADGKKVLEVDSPNGTQGAEPLTFIVETSGNYRLEVRSLEKTAPAGQYEVKINELRIATEKDKSHIAANVAANKAFSEAEALRQRGTAESLRNAIKKYEESLPLSRAVGYKRGEAVTLNNIGGVYFDLGEKQQALKFFNESLPLRRAVGDKRGEATTLNNIGLVYSDLGDKQQALKFYNESLPLFRAVGDKGREAVTLSNIGIVYLNLGEQQQALKFFNESLPLSRAVGDKRVEAATLNNIGAAYRDLGENQQALKFFNESLPLSRAVGDKRVEAFTLNNIGVVYSDLGEKEQALKFFNESLLLHHAVGDKRSEAHTLESLFYNLASVNPRFAIFYGKQSVNSFQILRSNVQGLDKNIQQTFLKSIEKIYRRLADALIAQERYAEAQQTLNSFKDQQFFDFSQSRQKGFLIKNSTF